MKNFKFSALFLSISLLLSFSAVASAEGMKCGAGKCGASMKVPKAAMKCGAGKYGTSIKTPKAAMKYGDSMKIQKESWYKKDSQEEYERGEIKTH